MSPITYAKKDIKSRDDVSVYIEVLKAKFSDVGKTGNEETGLHEFHYKVSSGFLIKFHLGKGVDERLLREVSRNAIGNWLGRPPVIDQASKQSGWMYGRWETPPGKPTLISEGQFLNCLEEAIRESEIALSEKKLIVDAEDCLRNTEKLEPRSHSIRESRAMLRATLDNLVSAIDSENIELIRSESGTVDETLQTLRRIERGWPQLNATFSTSGRKILFSDDRQYILVLTNEGEEVLSFSAEAKSLAFDIRFGPSTVESRKKIQVGLASFETEVQTVDLIVSCNDAEGRAYEATLRLGLNEICPEILFEERGSDNADFHPRLLKSK